MLHWKLGEMKRFLNAYFKVDIVMLFQRKYYFVFREQVKDANKITPKKITYEILEIYFSLSKIINKQKYPPTSISSIC